MDLTPYVDNLRRQLAVTAEPGGEEARALAERLTASLESAVRLTLLDALSAAADEITRDLAPGSVDVRLRGGNPAFVVTAPPPDRPYDDDRDTTGAGDRDPAGDRQAPSVASDGGTSRINLRLPETLKVRADQAASRDGLSVNAWLVRAVAAALDSADGSRGGRRHHPPSDGSRRYTGWVR